MISVVDPLGFWSNGVEEVYRSKHGAFGELEGTECGALTEKKITIEFIICYPDGTEQPTLYDDLQLKSSLI